MARKTKAEAHATRESLIDAAEYLFQARGVSRTSLADIAASAGATRGAIYWHFKDKADLFNAMMERVTLPLAQSLLSGDLASAAEPAQALRAAILHAFARIECDAQVTRVLQIATHRVELTAELAAVQQRQLLMQGQLLEKMEAVLSHAYALQQRTPALAVPIAALGLRALLEGILYQWLLSPGRFALAGTVTSASDVYLAGLGLVALAGQPVN